MNKIQQELLVEEIIEEEIPKTETQEIILDSIYGTFNIFFFLMMMMKH